MNITSVRDLQNRIIVLEERIADRNSEIAALQDEIRVANKLTAELTDKCRELERERDLALAHDSQPYPTAEDYERVADLFHKAEIKSTRFEMELAFLSHAAQDVMDTLEREGPSIVPHLMDTDDNAGERLRLVLRNLKAREGSA